MDIPYSGRFIFSVRTDGSNCFYVMRCRDGKFNLWKKNMLCFGEPIKIGFHVSVSEIDDFFDYVFSGLNFRPKVTLYRVTGKVLIPHRWILSKEV